MNHTSKHARGFTLIEVLVSLLIFGVGVIGVTALTTQSQKITHQAYQSMLATWHLHDMMELIRANASEARGSNSYIRAYDDDPPQAPSCINNSDSCDSDDMATYDIHLWLSAAQELTSGEGSISRTLSNGISSYTLILHWNGNRFDEDTTTINTSCSADSVTADTDLTCQKLTFDL